jgi:hypothetical protein
MRTQYFVSNILGILFFLCLPHGNVYAWFHSSGNCERCPIFKQPRSEEHVSKSYAFLPNVPDAAPEIRLYRSFFKDSFPASAGELKVDIPFNLLSASVTNIQAQLDRRIAANLRLKNLLEQYLAQQKKNAEMLKDLSIPYLDTPPNTKKAVSISDTEKLLSAASLKKKIAEELLFQGGGKKRPTLQDNHDLQPAPAEKKDRGNLMSETEKDRRLNFKNDYLKSPGGNGTYHQTYGQDTELPWIFSFVLTLLRYISNNKFGILSWAAVMAVIGLVGTIVVKR